MRYGILAVGLLVWLVAFIQVMLVSSLSDVVNDSNTQTAAGFGMVGLFVWLLGLLVVIPWPRFAMFVFLASAGLMFAGASDFPDLAVWGTVAVVFAVLSYVGLRQKRGKERKEKERDDMMAQMLKAQATMASVMTAPVMAPIASVPAALPPQPGATTTSKVQCATCGAEIEATSRFCAECGAPASASA